MSTTVISAILGFCGSLVVALITYKGVRDTNRTANDSMRNEIITQQALFNQKLDSLADEVRQHNNFARRLPVVEQQLIDDDRRLSQIEQRLNSNS